MHDIRTRTIHFSDICLYKEVLDVGTTPADRLGQPHGLPVVDSSPAENCPQVCFPSVFLWNSLPPRRLLTHQLMVTLFGARWVFP